MDELFEAIRAACDPSTWSRAVELTRADAVLGESVSDEQIVVRVKARDTIAAPKVTLYLDDAEWECECDTPADACVHAAAAAIAVRQARRAGADLPVADAPPPKLTYRFRRRDGRLFFDRGVRDGSKFEVIEATLDAVRSGRVQGPPVVVTKPDMTVEVALGSWRRGFPPEAAMPRLLAALARCEDVRLDGRPVQCSPTAVTPVAVVEDAGNGFRIRLEDAPGVVERFDGGAALVDGVLRPAGQPKLTGRETYAMARGWLFPASGVGELVSEVLPSLRRRIAVEIRTDRLPDALAEPPRILVDVRAEGDVLRATAWVVYGDPPTARVEVGRFVHLGGRPPVRDEDSERDLSHRLAHVLDMVPGLPERFAGEAAVRFAEKLRRFRGEVRGNAHERFFEAPPVVPRLEVDGDDLDVSFNVADRRAGGGAATRRPPSAGEVLDAWRAGQTMVALPDGGWSPLPSDWLHRFGDRVADLLAARDDSGRLPAASIPDLAALCELLDRPPPPSYERLRGVADGFDGIPVTEPPGNLAGVLRPYQRRGLDWLAFLRHAGLGGLLADDMGLGKTVQALAVLSGRCLVVAPTSVIFNWKDEVEKFRPELSVCLYHGPRRDLDPDAALTLTSYALLRLDADALSAVDWDVVILDEAQAIKNPSSQVARAAYGLPGRFRLSMTGTPVENRLDELWSQFHFANRGMLGGLGDFQERYARPIRDGDEAAAARLRERIRPFVLRRMKRDVAPELPPRTDGVLHCALDDDERAVYDAVRAATRDDVVRKLEQGGSVLAALEALLRLRQAACHPGLVPGQIAESSSKVRRLMGALETARADGHRALVFSQWTAFLDLIEPHLRAREVAYERLDGSTRDRAGVVARFQADDGPTAMLISLRAGGTGLNLTAADHVFLMDPWWNPAVEDQAADRTHRIGQEKPVMVYRMVAEDTVEQRILALQDSKRDLADAATGGAAMSAGLTRDDLLGLLD